MARYRIVVLKPFLYAGRQVVRGEVLEVTAAEALVYTHRGERATWDADQRTVPVRPRRLRRPVTH